MCDENDNGQSGNPKDMNHQFHEINMSPMPDVDIQMPCSSTQWSRINANCWSETPKVFILDDVGENVIPQSDAGGDDTTFICLDCEVSDCTIAYLKKLKKASKRSSVKKQEFANMCVLLFSNKLDDFLFMSIGV